MINLQFQRALFSLRTALVDISVGVMISNNLEFVLLYWCWYIKDNS